MGDWTSCPTFVLCCSVFHFLKTKQLQILSTFSARFRYMLQADNNHLTEHKKNLGCPFMLMYPTVFLLMYGGEGMGKSTVYRNFPTGMAYFLRVLLKRKTESMTLWFLHCNVDTPVLVAWLTFHKCRWQKASWFVFKDSKTVYLYFC